MAVIWVVWYGLAELNVDKCGIAYKIKQIW